MRLALLLLGCVTACGGGQTAPKGAQDHDDLHRHLTAAECGTLYDFMHEHGWMAEAEAPRETVVKGCLEAPDTTRAFMDCVLKATSREEADRCR